jgi:hypothetical protein
VLQWDPRRLWRSAFANGSLGAVLDFVSDWALAAFAVWTLIAYAGMATEAPVSILTPIWLATTPFLGLALMLLRRDRAPSMIP